MKTLAICIPTYRRPDMLRRCVMSAIRSAGTQPIRIFIADDSMSDINQPLLEELCVAHPFISWQRNSVNLGIDRNIQHVLTLSDCDYAWLIGEDDQFLPGGIERMVERLQSPVEPFVFSNYQFVNEDHSRVLGTAIPDTHDSVQAASLFVPETLWSVGFIGCCVVECTTWNTLNGDAYDGTYFTHVGRILDLLARRTSVTVSAQPAVANRSQGADTFTWKKDAFGVFLGFERMCRIAAQRNPALADAIAQAAANYRKRSGYLSLKSTFRLRSQGAFDMRQFRVHIAPHRIEAWRKAWLLSLALTPAALLKPFAQLYVVFAERRRRRADAIRSA